MTKQPKPPGRPPLSPDDETTRVNISLPAKQLDAYIKRALAEDVSIPEIIRRELRESREVEEGKK